MDKPSRCFKTDETSRKEPSRRFETDKTSQKEPSRRFETDEMSRKDPQDASKLTKHLGRRFETDETSRKDSRRFETDETSRKDPIVGLVVCLATLTPPRPHGLAVPTFPLHGVENSPYILPPWPQWPWLVTEPSRRFETDETSQKDPQDASKLMKRPSRRFKTDKTSWKDPQDASELMKRPEGTILDFNMNFGSVHQLRSLNLDFRSVMANTTGSLGFGSVTNWISNGTIVSDLRLGFGSVEGAPLSKIQKMQIPHFSGKWWEIVENATLR
ncbi:hypothetical protein RhiirA5_436737 [Rhizophagus irregularis]|uniref:Uncharacterized protein n=1 Tax=Rhizophagus irregularis TaxID=588596 RepID=A0A2N0NLH8_9GLOM|nr:hypothetical protein RhiirA5_436737 [Rhizophagus irregularis]